MTEEDWSGTGEASETPTTGSWSEPPAEADETWGESAIGETTDGAEEERTIAIPATTRRTSTIRFRHHACAGCAATRASACAIAIRSARRRSP